MWWDEGIVFLQLKKDTQLSFELALDMVYRRKALMNEFKCPLFIDWSGLLSIDQNARRLLAGTYALQNVYAMAFFSNNEFTDVVCSSIIVLDKPRVPTKQFNHVVEGVKWLEPFRFQS